MMENKTYQNNRLLCYVKWLTGLLWILLFFNDMSAQTSGFHNVCLILPEIAIIDIEPNTNSISFSLSAPNEAGEEAIIVENSSPKWINYSSSFSSNGTARSILAQIQGSLPTGISLNISAANYTGSGAGTMGVSMGTVGLSTSPQTIISNIGRGYTGNGQNNGHLLNFSLLITNYELLDINESKTVTVIYTITE